MAGLSGIRAAGREIDARGSKANQHGGGQVEHGAQSAKFEKLHYAREAGVHEFKTQHQRQAEAGAYQPERHHAVARICMKPKKTT